MLQGVVALQQEASADVVAERGASERQSVKAVRARTSAYPCVDQDPDEEAADVYTADRDSGVLVSRGGVGQQIDPVSAVADHQREPTTSRTAPDNNQVLDRHVLRIGELDAVR